MSLLDMIGAAILEHAPEAFPAIARTLAAQGIDLGPMTPDTRKHAAAIAARIDAELDERSELDRARVRSTHVGGIEVVVHDTDPAPPPTPSSRPSER